MFYRSTCLFVLFSLFFIACGEAPTQTAEEVAEAPAPEAISLLGDSLYAAEPSAALFEKYETRREEYLADNSDADKLIWYGRFTAYMGNYQEAIQIYTTGIEQFPEDARMYRHRGHRYISIRQFGKAIADFEKAAELIEGAENEIEPDGMPNAQNIPVSTLHGNIWYHLGLAYYLEGDMPNALRAYTNCFNSTSNDDNVVSSTHWLYMINRRLGDEDAAQAALEVIEEEMNVIENFDYHRACLFYKGLLSEEDLLATEQDQSSSDAVNYAVANWYFYHDELTTAEDKMRELMANGGWNSFGYIAAEADVARSFSAE